LGCILLGRPRVPFRLDAEVFDLLRILAHEVSVHLAQERAAASLLQARALRDYGERFAFVAHDVKNVASQLSLLLSNAETHLADPAFQKDMLATVRASVARIGGLIRRLEPAAAEADPGATAPLDVAAELAALLTARRRGSAADVPLEVAADGHAMVVMAAASLRSAVTHLLDNAEAAAGPAGSVRVTLRTPPGMVAVDIADTGPGMTPEFIRDELFRPFATRTEGGSGLGAFQARTLLRAAGGELAVMSTPGRGTTMRLTLPRVTLPQPEGAPTRIPDLAAAEA
jgi:putative PEP-CTERM system histidine kinase